MIQSSPGRPKLADHLFILGAWGIACLVLFTSLGAAPLTDLDEGAFSEATREMMARGDWISPWLLDAPRFDKPVLIHWLQMAAFSVTGFSSYGARLPSALMGLIWIGGIGGWAYLVARRVAPAASVQAYGWAVLLSATCLGIPAMSRAATADATLNAFLVLSLLFVWRALWPEKESETGRVWIRLAAVFVGLGLLTKGPIAVLVPGVASLLAVLTCSRVRRWFRLSFDPLAWFIALIIAAPWYALQFQAQGMAFVEGFLGLHNLGRFTNTMHGFSGGGLYYPTWTIIATLPWIVPVIGSLSGAVGSSLSAQLLRSPELRLAWVVFVFVLTLFSFSATKLPHYGFYGLSGLVVIVSLWLAVGPVTARYTRRAVLLLSLFVSSVVVTSAPLWISWATQIVTDNYYQLAIEDAAIRLHAQKPLFIALTCLAVIGFLIGFVRFRLGVGTLALTAASTLYGVVVPVVMQALQKPIRSVASLIREHESQTFSGRRILTWKLTAPSLSFYAGRVIPAGSPAVGDLVVLPSHLTSELSQKNGVGVRLISEKNGISLVEILPMRLKNQN